ncbi:hypothetical protein PM082_012313 [Marasmius tenuissimus]|nr:hypothetical protein PM082_012313 [Marasmius tenuissimus]
MKLTHEILYHYQTKGMPPAVQGVSLTGQVVLITGANTGLGFEAAKHFAIRGPGKLILVCRNEERGRNAVDRVKSETGFDRVELWTSDLSSFESVRSVRDKILNLERLDILVENAGVAMDGYYETKDGWETTLQVNVLSTALRIILHLPKLIETAREHSETVPRIVYVSSASPDHAQIPAEFIVAPNTLKAFHEDRGENAKDWSTKRYYESKVLADSFMRALQTHLPTVTCTSVAPGFCESDLSRHATGEQAEVVRKLKEVMAYTSEEGGRQLLYAAIGERDKEDQMRGAFLAYSEIWRWSDFLLSEGGKRLEGKMWKEILEVVTSVDEKTKEVIQEYLS